jgi:hypothetical protein
MPITFSSNITQYTYYHTGQKFPLLTVTYDISGDASSTDTSITITGNRNITVGIKDENFSETYSIYPNPAKTNFSLDLSNNSAENCNMCIFDATGALIKNYNFGNKSIIKEKIDISDLKTGVYFVKTSLGSKNSTRKLVVE